VFTLYIFDHISRNSSLNEMSQTKFVEEIKTPPSMFSNFYFFFENPAAYDIMWKNIVE